MKKHIYSNEDFYISFFFFLNLLMMMARVENFNFKPIIISKHVFELSLITFIYLKYLNINLYYCIYVNSYKLINTFIQRHTDMFSII